MATISVGAGNTFRPHRYTRVGYFPEGASQSFKAGQVVLLSAGKLVKGATDPAAATIVGVAAEAATGVTDRKVGVYLATEMAEFRGNVQNTGVLALANVGAGFGIVLDATFDIFRVDLSDTTNIRVTVTELIDAVGDVNGSVVFRFPTAARIPYSA